jgi:glycosyltransferase involved in cell wall biosynthesis
MKILHIRNIANVASILAKEQTRLGYISKIFTYNTVFGLPSDYNINLSIYDPKPLKFFKLVSSFIENKLYSYDVYHFHFGSLVPYSLDLPLFKLSNKKIILHYHGDDIRGKKENFLARHLCRIKFVSTPDLLKYVPDAIWMPNPIDLEKLTFVGCENDSEEVRIVHAPTDRIKKGTKYVIKAFNQLRDEGYNIKLILVENTPHEKALEIYKHGDIVVDQLLAGVECGVFGLECMALGKPVCTYISEEFESYFTSSPVVNTSPSNILTNLRILIEDPLLRAKLGKKGRTYVESNHNPLKIAKKVLNFYEN